MQLSQHPNVSLQLFATNYLQDFAAGKTPNFIRFKTILQNGALWTIQRRHNQKAHL